MSVRFRFIDVDTDTVIADTPALSANIKWTLNQSSSWSGSFPKNVLAVQGVAEGNNVEIYYNNELLIEGVLQQFSEKWSKNELVLSLQGRGRLDDLYSVRAYSQAYYESKELLLILGELLRRAGWRLNKINTLENPTQVTTIDLRSEKRLLPQIVTLIEGIPGVFFRYGGFVAGKHSIDVGSFSELSGIELHRPPDGELVQEFLESDGAIIDINQSVTLTDIINAVEVIGGDVQDNLGVTRAITLRDSLVANPALSADPDFPIVTEIANYVYYIHNNSVSALEGSQSVERYTQYTPPKESGNATLAAINAAALSLYQRGVAFLQDHSSNVREVSVSAIGDNLYVDVGDTVFVHATYRQPIIDPFTDEVEFVESSIDDDIRVTALSVDFSGDKTVWEFDLIDGATLVEQEDLFVSVYDETKRESPPAGAVYAPAFTPVFATIVTNVSGGGADDELSNGLTARQVTIDLPAAPVGATNVYLVGASYGTSPDGTVIAEIVSDPVFGGDAVMKIGLKNVGWVNAYSATLTTHIVWI
jgi:hypothetical protein